MPTLAKLTRAVAILTALAGCDDAAPAAPDHPDTPPRVVLDTLIIDSLAGQVTFAMQAVDPDGPVGIVCDGPWAGTGVDSYQASGTFRDMRFWDDWYASCTLSQADTTVFVYGLGGPQPNWVDRLPHPDFPIFLDTLRANVSVRVQVGGHDDWLVVSHRIAVAPGPLPNASCIIPWIEVAHRDLATSGFLDTIRVTFPAPGNYCVVSSLEDDNGHSFGARIDVVVQ